MIDYINKKCWQATSIKTIRRGKIINQKLESSGWLLVQVAWTETDSSWERVNNLSFDFTFFEDNKK